MAFHAPGFVRGLNSENQQGFWFQRSDAQRQRVGRPWGPGDPQSLNRYSYVRNNPLRYTDPSGHTAYLDDKEAAQLMDDLDDLADEVDAFLTLAGVPTLGGIPLIELLKRFQQRAVASFAANFWRLALCEVAIAAARVAGPAAAVGGLLLTQLSGDLRTLAGKVRNFSEGDGGIASAVGGGYIGFLDRANGNFDTWTPDYLNGNFRRCVLLANMPSSWALGASPVGDPTWYRGHHFSNDRKWIYLGP